VHSVDHGDDAAGAQHGRHTLEPGGRVDPVPRRGAHDQVEGRLGALPPLEVLVEHLDGAVGHEVGRGHLGERSAELDRRHRVSPGSERHRGLAGATTDLQHASTRSHPVDRIEERLGITRPSPVIKS